MNRIYQQIINGRQRYLLMVLLLFFTAIFFCAKQVQAQGTPLCAEVKIVIEQKLSLERQAFDAKMIIGNGLQDADVEDVSIELLFFDQNEQPVVATTNPDDEGALFFYRTDSLTGIDSIDGAGQVAADSSAEIHWLIIPALGASADTGTLYYVGAKVTYTLNGVTTTVDVTPDFIVVKPMPELVLDYFLPTDVYADDAFTDEIEPPVPFTLGVRIKNIGSGAAVKTAIESAQPKIVENKLNLLIDFKILGGYVSDEPAGQSLLLNFGDIAANSSKVGRWNMITTLSGRFVEFNAYYSHADELGGAVTSLLEEVNTHTLVHDVKVDLPGRDNIRDFLALDEDVLRVYESDGVDTLVADQSATAQLRLLGEKAELTYQNVPGFTYVKVADPYQESRIPVKAVRSDGKVLPPENVWLSKTRNEDGETWSYHINLFDANTTGNTTGSYDVFFADNPFASISGLVFDDINGNGIQEEGERGVGVAKLTLTGLSEDGSAVVATAYTDVQGRFGFKQIQPGRYALEVASADGMIDIAAIAGDAGGTAGLNKIIGIDLGTGAVAGGYHFAKQWSTVIPPNLKADLSMEVTASTVSPNLGEQVAFVYRVGNTGPDEAKQIKVAIVWPEGLTNVTCEIAGDNEQYIDGVWSIDKLEADTAKELNCTAQASDLSVERTITAMVASQTLDPVVDNNEAFVTLQPVVSQAKADLSINITASTLNPGMNEQLAFIYTAHNAGPDQVKQAEVTMTWPTGLSDVNCQADAEDQYSNGVWTIDQLLAGTSKELSCNAKVSAMNGTMNVIAAITSSVFDPVVSNNSDRVILEIVEEGEFSSISGIVYLDTNNNAVHDDGDDNLGNVRVVIEGKEKTGERVSRYVHTDRSGQFRIHNLKAGSYTISVDAVENTSDRFSKVGSAGGVVALGYVNHINLGEHTVAQGYEFGKYAVDSVTDPMNGSFKGTVNVIDSENKLSGLANVRVTLASDKKGQAGTVVYQTTQTDSNGKFSFDGLPRGLYAVSVEQVDGLEVFMQHGTTSMPWQENMGIISDIYEDGMANTLEFRKRDVTSNSHSLSSFSGRLFLDSNGNGIQDAGEIGLRGITVGMQAQGVYNKILSTLTDEYGNFVLKNIDPAYQYQLYVRYVVFDSPGSITLGSSGGEINDQGVLVKLEPGADAQGYFLAKQKEFSSSMVSGWVYLDQNQNGVMDDGELYLGGVKVRLAGNNHGSEVITDSTGSFVFTGLEIGSYSLQVEDVVALINGEPTLGTAGGQVRGKHWIELTNQGVEHAQNYYFAKIPLEVEPSLSGFIYEDVNGNGLFDEGDTGIAGAVASLIQYPLIRKASTDETGYFVFENLPFGSYTLTSDDIQGMSSSSAIVGNAGGRLISSDSISIDFTEATPVAKDYYFAKRSDSATDLRSDLSLSVVDGTYGKPTPGKQGSLYWTIKNNGPDKALDTIVSFKVPEHVRIIPSSSYPLDNGQWLVGDLLPQQSKSMTLYVEVDSLDADVRIEGNVQSLRDDPDLENNVSEVFWKGRDSAQTDLKADFDTSSQNTPSLNSSKTLYLTIANNGPDTAFDVVTDITLPPNVVLSSVTTVGGGKFENGQWLVESLKSGESKKLYLYVKAVELNEDTLIQAQIKHSHGTDIDLNNNLAQVFWKGRNNFQSDVSVILQKTGSSAINKNISITAEVKNVGPDTAFNTVVRIDLPASVTLIRTPNNCVFDGNTGICTINEKKVSSFSDSLKFTVQTSTFDGSPTIKAVVSSQSKDPDLANNSASLILKAGF